MITLPKIVDEFRFVSSLNTIVRNLNIVSQIVKIIGKRHLPKELLKSALIDWSYHEEQKSSVYKNHRGKITNEGKPTSAFQHYLNFAIHIGLITSHGDFLMLSRLGSLLNKLMYDSRKTESLLTNEEKLFYLINLFQCDADGLLLTIYLLIQHTNIVAQERLLEKFQINFKERLLIKQRYATEQSKSIIRDKYRVIEYEWKKAKSYAKHLIPPRLEWMADLCIIDRKMKSSTAFYQLGYKGKKFYNSLINLPDSNLNDVNERWIRTKAMKSFTDVVYNNGSMTMWLKISPAKRLNLLKTLLENAFDYFNVEGAMRISLFHGFLYILINFATKEKIVVEFCELENEFKNTIIVGNRKYSLRPAARINEGYISLNLI